MPRATNETAIYVPILYGDTNLLEKPYFHRTADKFIKMLPEECLKMNNADFPTIWVGPET